MKKIQHEKVLWAIVVVTALAEAVCGKKFMKRIRKRLRVLDKMAEVEVWVGVFNEINPEKAVSTNNSAFANSPIVKKESRRILDKLKINVSTDIDTIHERMKKIIDRKLKDMEEETKKK